MNNYSKVGDYIDSEFKGITPKYVIDSSILVLNQKCIRNNKINYTLAQYTDDNKNIPDSKLLKEGDILINSTGTGTAGRCAYVHNISEGKRLITDSHILVLRCKSKDIAACISYQLYLIEDLMMTFMTGSSGQSEFDKVRLFDLQLKVPNDPVNLKSCLKLLFDIDSKIEINTKINSKLEQLVKSYYDYWFMQFDFPNKNGKPYKASGGKMIWNEILKREIPENWECKTLDNFVSLGNDQTNPQMNSETIYRHYSIPNFDKSGSYALEKGSTIRSNKFVIKELDILVSKLNPWFSRVVYSQNEDNQISSTEFVVWRPEDLPTKNYLYMLAKDNSFIQYCVQSSSGTSHSHKRINPEVMMDYPIAYNSKLIKQFGELINPLLAKYFKNKEQNIRLSALRDWLLPLLMNGQAIIKS